MSQSLYHLLHFTCVPLHVTSLSQCPASMLNIGHGDISWSSLFIISFLALIPCKRNKPAHAIKIKKTRSFIFSRMTFLGLRIPGRIDNAGESPKTMYVCVCVCVRERQGGREYERKRDSLKAIEGTHKGRLVQKKVAMSCSHVAFMQWCFYLIDTVVVLFLAPFLLPTEKPLYSLFFLLLKYHINTIQKWSALLLVLPGFPSARVHWRN